MSEIKKRTKIKSSIHKNVKLNTKNKSKQDLLHLNSDINYNQNILIEDELKMNIQTLVTVSTALWRIKTKLDNETINGLPQQLRHLPRHIQAAWDAFSSGAIEIKDPTGKPYVPGMAVNVIAFQPTEGVTNNIILETIKPSIYYNNKLIQQADVIVASQYNN